MPIAINPDSTFKYVLFSDRGKENKPAFILRYLTSRQWRKIAKMSEDFETSGGAEKVLDKALDVIKSCLVGWENMSIEFNFDKIEDILVPVEITELMQAAISQMPTVEDKKKLDSQSPSDTGSSAANVPVK